MTENRNKNISKRRDDRFKKNHIKHWNIVAIEESIDENDKKSLSKLFDQRFSAVLARVIFNCHFNILVLRDSQFLWVKNIFIV